MINKLSGWDDTIVALATPPGMGAIAVIRLSGPGSCAIATALFPAKKIAEQKSHTLHLGMLCHNGVTIDEVLLSVFKSPNSYTGEDVIEISCHGSQYIQEQVILACCSLGARLARAGEFTQRAFLNGKLDLAQAEAVADLIAANTAAAQRTALQNIRGGFSHDLVAMKDQLVAFAALIELELDFAAEDVEFADRQQFTILINEIEEKATKLSASFKLGNVIKNGVRVAIIGKPNAGKSTLLNTLLNEERAIVSEIAGTTRDTIEEVLNINGVLFRLIDTAGIRSHSTDAIEIIGMERSLHKMNVADIVLYIFDVNTETKTDLRQQVDAFKKAGIQYLLVGNKSDKAKTGYEGEGDIHFISAKNNVGIQLLKNTIFQATVGSNLNTEATIVTNSRHFEGLQKILQSLQEIKNGLSASLPGDLIATDIRTCLYHLGDITGEITNDDKLDYIFSKFCIGK